MQRKLGDDIPLGRTVSAFDSVGSFPSIVKTDSDFDSAKSWTLTPQATKDVSDFVYQTLQKTQ